ncbi:DUF397 domain-containing protein [Actinomadura violacea]|uniref:DUF397 domain-containing protein n=1 Tax=Actinomadura violacea TaxID=2819934 RepID=A0ABS3S7L2_9ACTN|nr:DUF397 domain-containing protein [Actinomadura violacea]MBO2464984.1 DUF397 domain-containing protein [Actinomadura violacea]
MATAVPSPDEYAGWRKSSRSKDSAECVEVAAGIRPGRGIGVRDSKQHGLGPVLALSPATWHRFLQQVRNGSHDLP